MLLVFFLIYQFILHLALPFFIFIQLLRMASRSFSMIQLFERIGIRLPKQAPETVWVNAVSAGEVLLAKSLMDQWKDSSVIITVGNKSAYDLAKSRLNPTQYQVFFTPLDLFWLISRWSQKIQPKLYIAIEHDLWPMTLKTLEKKKVPRLLLNANIKDKDFKSYQRWSFLPPHLFRFTQVYTQNQQTKDKLNTLQVSKKAKVVGNLKIAPSPKVKPIPKNTDKVIIALASFHFPEEQKVIHATNLHQKILWVLIPRHIQRAKKLLQQFSEYQPVLWSQMEEKTIAKQKMIIVDSMGEARAFMRSSDIVLMGDSFRKSLAGHNILEPMELGIATLYGQEYKSFPELTADFESTGATLRVKDTEIASTLKRLIKDRALREKTGKKGLHAFQALQPNRERLIQEIKALVQAR